MNRISNHAKVVYKKVTHVLFDVDGLLLDTEKIYKKAISDIAKSYGKRYTTEIQVKVVGRPDLDGATVAVSEMKLPLSPEQFLRKYKLLAHDSIAKVPLMPGAERLVQHLHQHDIPIAVATSANRDSFVFKTQKHQRFFSLFHHIVTAGSDPEVKHGKPSPDVFLVCASRFKDKPKPEQCLVFEDAPNGVQAAVEAGMQVVVVPDKDLDDKLCQKATLKLESLEDIQLELFGLPPFN